MEQRYNSFNKWLRARFGERVHKLCIDAGFTCPNRDGSKATGGCAFCDVAGSGARHIQSTLNIRRQVLAQVDQSFQRYHARKYIAYFQAYTNTYGTVPRLRRIYEAALISDYVVGLSVGTRGDCVTEEVCELLASFQEPHREVWLELGLQSANQETLDRINRAERVEDFVRACAMANTAGVQTVGHVIFGLPGDSHDDCLRSIDLINECGCSGLKIHNLYIDAQAPMAESWRKGEIRVWERGEYIGTVCDALERLNPSILIHRLTGEAPPPMLLAPDWASDKAKVLASIDTEMARRGTRQGSSFQSKAPAC